MRTIKIVATLLTLLLCGCSDRKASNNHEVVTRPRSGLTRVDRAPAGRQMHVPPRNMIKIKKEFADELNQ